MIQHGNEEEFGVFGNLFTWLEGRRGATTEVLQFEISHSHTRERMWAQSSYFLIFGRGFRYIAVLSSFGSALRSSGKHPAVECRSYDRSMRSVKILSGEEQVGKWFRAHSVYMGAVGGGFCFTCLYYTFEQREGLLCSDQSEIGRFGMGFGKAPTKHGCER